MSLFCALSAHGWQQCLELQGAARFDCLEAAEVSHIGQLEFELSLADAARAAGRFDYAAVVLERIVLMFPEQAGARLDLVVLSLRAGDTITAAEHLNYLLSLPDPPPLAQQLILELNKMLNPGQVAVPGAEPDFRLKLAGGYDDNPNLGIGQQAIDIIIDGVGQVLVPDDGVSPSPSAFFNAAFGVDYAYSKAGRVRGELSGRQYESGVDEDVLATALQVDHQVGEDRYLQGSFSDFRLANGVFLTTLGLGGKQILGDCQCYGASVGVDLMEGDEEAYRSFRGRAGAEVKKVWKGLQVYGFGSLNLHRQPYAPWGDTLSAMLGTDVALPVLSGIARAGYSWYGSFDEDAYSPLFGGDRRDLLRNQLSVGYSRLLASRYELYTEWSYVDQRSAIPLYDYDRFVAEVGLRLSF